MSIIECFARCVAETPDREALWSRGESLRLSFAELAERVAIWRRLLRREPRLPVALAVANGTAFIELFLALRQLEVPVVAMDGGLTLAEQRRLCRQLGVATLMHGHGDGERLGAGVWRARIAVETLTEAPPATALVKLTSGSTGVPVGLCFDDAALVADIRQIGEGMELTRHDRVLMAIPLSHSYGFSNGMLSLAVLGTPLVLEPGFFPASLLAALTEGQATFFPIVPPLARSLGNVVWPQGLPLRRVICAGGRLQAPVAEQFLSASGRPVHNFYGSTETGGITFEDRPLEATASDNVGRPLPGVRVEVDGRGRVTVRSAANRQATFGDTRPVADRTVTMGDLGEWCEDGRLRLIGRTADFLKVGGRKLPAARLEEALRRLHGVEDVAVVGADDPVRGERAVAFVVARSWPLDLAPVAAALRPREMRRIDALPYTGRGKLDRARLRELASRSG